MTETGSDALPVWEAHCKSLGLLITVPRRATVVADGSQAGHPPADSTVDLLQSIAEHFGYRLA